jgi:hypothetical protein
MIYFAYESLEKNSLEIISGSVSSFKEVLLLNEIPGIYDRCAYSSFQNAVFNIIEPALEENGREWIGSYWDNEKRLFERRVFGYIGFSKNESIYKIIENKSIDARRFRERGEIK